MAKSKPAAAPVPAASPRPAEYTVVARRYRPQQFADLIGQEHVAQALVNALQSGRVAHAYLFTGARGVGKTSAARILAKALNCEKGATTTPCDACDSCQGIAEGQDIDVLEIDGASNRGIDDARELRQNTGFKPTRSRYKIYIIDEVHMLTKDAFNALLKTMEEPPEHVKFILATTEVQKIPITILSRCQRFDFAHVGPGKIFEQLKRVVDKEGLAADDDALKLVARRAAGSMRDSQSLLDQLLASSTDRLTLDRVHSVLGSTGDEQVVELASAIFDRDAKTALDKLTAWIDRGLQVNELLDQLVDYWRSLMLAVAAPDLRELPVSPAVKEVLLRQAGTLSLDAILAGLDIWTTTKARMRGNAHTQVLLEMAVIRLCRLDDMLSVGQLIQSIQQNGLASGTPAARGDGGRGNSGEAPKKNDLAGLANGPSMVKNERAIEAEEAVLPLSEATLPEIWSRFTRVLVDRAPILSNHLKSALSPAIFGPNSLAIRFHTSYNHLREACSTEPNLQRMQEALRKLTGQPVTVKVEVVGGPAPETTKSSPPPPAGDRKKALLGLPYFKKAAEVLGAQVWHVDEGFNPTTPAKPADTEPESVPDTESAPDEV